MRAGRATVRVVRLTSRTQPAALSAYRRGPLLPAAAAALMIGSVIVAVIGRGHLYAESVPFVVFAMVGPALLVLGTPWAPRQARLPLPAAVAAAVVFACVCLAWRLPPVLDAISRYPVLQVPELALLLLAGTALWLQLVNSPSSRGRLTRRQRAAVAAIAMWSVWIMAYAFGFANHALVHRYDMSGSLNVVMDQEIATGLIWLVSAACFIPVICVTMLGWLADSSAPATGSAADALARDPADAPGIVPGVRAVRGWGREPRPGKGRSA